MQFLEEPSGVNFHSEVSIPMRELCIALQAVVEFLREDDPDVELLRFHDWRQHDDYRAPGEPVDFGAVLQIVDCPRDFYSDMPGDTNVRLGVGEVVQDFGNFRVVSIKARLVGRQCPDEQIHSFAVLTPVMGDATEVR